MIAKGTPVVCECRLRQNVWEANGVKHYDTSFIAETVKVLPKKITTTEQMSEFSNLAIGPNEPTWTTQGEKVDISAEEGLL